MSNKVIKELNGWLSSFIWSKRKPRLKLSILQLSSTKGGLDLLNIRLYQCQLRFIVERLSEDPKSVWLDLESSQSNCLLQNLLFGHNTKLSRALCNAPFRGWKAGSIQPLLFYRFWIIQSSCQVLQTLTYGMLLVFIGYMTCLRRDLNCNLKTQSQDIIYLGKTSLNFCKFANYGTVSTSHLRLIWERELGVDIFWRGVGDGLVPHQQAFIV